MKQNWRATYFLPFCQMDNKSGKRGSWKADKDLFLHASWCNLPNYYFFTKDRVYYRLRT